MVFNQIRIGDIIEPYSQNCNIPNLTAWEVSGINREKEFFEPSKQVGADTSKYKIVPQNYFACNLMHVGRDVVLPISLNTTDKNKIVSPAYTIFRIKENSGLLNEYFFMWLKSAEKDRFFWMFTDASVRDGLSWTDFCNITLHLPPVEIQKKYAAVYQALLANQHAYEQGLEDLKLTCDAYIEHLQKSHSLESIGQYLTLNERKNISGKLGVDDVVGLSTSKEIIATKASLKNVSINNYLIFPKNNFAYVSDTSRRGDKISLAFNNQEKDFLVSSITTIFYADEEQLYPEYLAMFFSRSEFDRYARYHSWGSARETFTWAELCAVKIPIPPLPVQKSIVDIYRVYMERKAINERLKAQIKDICPILIKGAVDEMHAQN